MTDPKTDMTPGAIFVFTFPLYAIYNLITHGRKLP